MLPENQLLSACEARETLVHSCHAYAANASVGHGRDLQHTFAGKHADLVTHASVQADTLTSTRIAL